MILGTGLGPAPPAGRRGSSAVSTPPAAVGSGAGLGTRRALRAFRPPPVLRLERRALAAASPAPKCGGPAPAPTHPPTQSGRALLPATGSSDGSCLLTLPPRGFEARCPSPPSLPESPHSCRRRSACVRGLPASQVRKCGGQVLTAAPDLPAQRRFSVSPRGESKVLYLLFCLSPMT